MARKARPRGTYPANRQPQKDAFLAALRDTGIVTTACLTAGIKRGDVYDWRDGDEDFAIAWDAALEDGTDAQEDELLRRGFQGTEEPVFHQGEICGHLRKYSDTAAIFMLKARRPEKYRERSQVEASIKGEVTIDDVGAKLLAKLDALALRQAKSGADQEPDAR